MTTRVTVLVRRMKNLELLKKGMNEQVNILMGEFGEAISLVSIKQENDSEAVRFTYEIVRKVGPDIHVCSYSEAFYDMLSKYGFKIDFIEVDWFNRSFRHRIYKVIAEVDESWIRQ